MTEKYVQIDGGKHQQQLLVQDIVNWFSSKYFKRFKSYTIEIDLLDIDGKVNGWCYEQEPKYCCVEIDKRQKGDDFITCIFHELTHMEQFLRNRLGINEDNDNIYYLDRAYEIDAYEKQEELLEEWKNETSK